MKLGRYEVVRELGKGAMGIVYLAKDPLIGRLVALKTIRPAAHAEDDETKEFQQRFIREAQAAGILNHPAIVTVHDIGTDDESGVSFIAMEYVEGQNLKEMLAQGRALSFDQIGDIISQIGDAIDFAHTKGIVHRDVKPANIILIDGNRAKITDFGIAKIATAVANLTTTGQFLGTPNYMAPEQIKGAPVDGRTDIFSLGICLYESLTRRKPFGGDSLTTISYKIVHEPFPPIHEINPQIPEGYEEVVAMCLAKDPAKRYQRGRDVANALRAVIKGERPSRPFEPLLAEETQITRDRLPTMDIPLPSVAVGAPETPRARPARANATPAASTVAVPLPTMPPQPAPPAVPREPVADKLRRTMTGVRALPLWRRRIPFNIAVGVVAGSVALFSGLLLLIRGKDEPIPVVDRRLEAKIERQRQLRTQGNTLLRQGRVKDAHTRFDELYKLAPKSPYVIDVLQKLSAIRVQEETSRQQLTQAQQQRDAGIALYNEKKFAEAIAALQQSFSINPSDEQTADYLKLAQQEEQKLLLSRSTRAKPPVRVAGPAKPVTTTMPPPAGGDGRPVNVSPASLTTFFNSPFPDGYIVVQVGSDVVTRENLWEERRRVIKRKFPRVVNSTASFAARNADLIVSVVVPSQKISDRRVIPHNFQPGSTQRLVVSYNPQNKTFDYQLN